MNEYAQWILIIILLVWNALLTAHFLDLKELCDWLRDVAMGEET